MAVSAQCKCEGPALQVCSDRAIGDSVSSIQALRVRNAFDQMSVKRSGVGFGGDDLAPAVKTGGADVVPQM